MGNRAGLLLCCNVVSVSRAFLGLYRLFPFGDCTFELIQVDRRETCGGIDNACFRAVLLLHCIMLSV